MPIIVLPEAVEAYKAGDKVELDFAAGKLTVGDKVFTFNSLPEKLMNIFANKGLVNYYKNN